MHNVIVRHGPDVQFWSNDLGWTDLENATRFTDEERKTLNLPMNSYWATDVTELLED